MKVKHFQTKKRFWASWKEKNTNPNTFWVRQITEKNVRHVVSFKVSGEVKDVRRKMSFKWSEDKWVEIQRKIFIVVRHVVSSRASEKSCCWIQIGSTNNTVTVGGSSSNVSVWCLSSALQRTILVMVVVMIHDLCCRVYSLIQFMALMSHWNGWIMKNGEEEDCWVKRIIRWKMLIKEL